MIKHCLNHAALRLGEEKGISLVEALVAIAILGIGITAFITALSTGSIAVGAQDEATIVQRLAQTQMESIKAAAYDSSGGSYSPVTAPASYAISINVNSSIYTNSDIQKVTVTVSREGNPVLTLEDYKVNR